MLSSPTAEDKLLKSDLVKENFNLRNNSVELMLTLLLVIHSRTPEIHVFNLMIERSFLDQNKNVKLCVILNE